MKEKKEIENILTEGYKGDNSWIERLSKFNLQDFGKNDFKKENSQWYWNMYLVDLTGEIHRFRLNYTEENACFKYMGKKD